MIVNKETIYTKDASNKKIKAVREFVAPVEQVWKAGQRVHCWINGGLPGRGKQIQFQWSSKMAAPSFIIWKDQMVPGIIAGLIIAQLYPIKAMKD